MTEAKSAVLFSSVYYVKGLFKQYYWFFSLSLGNSCFVFLLAECVVMKAMWMVLSYFYFSCIYPLSLNMAHVQFTIIMVWDFTDNIIGNFFGKNGYLISDKSRWLLICRLNWQDRFLSAVASWLIKVMLSPITICWKWLMFLMFPVELFSTCDFIMRSAEGKWAQSQRMYKEGSHTSSREGTSIRISVLWSMTQSENKAQLCQQFHNRFFTKGIWRISKVDMNRKKRTIARIAAM